MMNEFIGIWTDDEVRLLKPCRGWSFFKGRCIWTAWQNNKNLIVCKALKSLVYWVTLASKKTIDCNMCKNCQVGGCGHCRTDRTNHANLLAGKIKNFD